MPKMELKLVIFPDHALRSEVGRINEEQIKSPLIRNTAGAMIRLMYQLNGIGLAAQQAGVPGAMFVLDPFWHKTGKKKPKIFLNPVIYEYAGDLVEVRGPGEGCLSTPYGYFAPVKRREKVLLEWMDLAGITHKDWFEGMEAIAIQHEVDHLHGILFVDRLSRLRQDMFKRKVEKVRRQYTKGFKKTLRYAQVAARAEKRLDKARQRKQDLEDRRALKASKEAGWSSKPPEKSD